MDKLKIHKNWKLEKLKIRKIRKIENSRKKIQKLVLTENSEKIEFNFCTKKWISSAPYFWIFAPKKRRHQLQMEFLPWKFKLKVIFKNIWMFTPKMDLWILARKFNLIFLKSWSNDVLKWLLSVFGFFPKDATFDICFFAS